MRSRGGASANILGALQRKTTAKYNATGNQIRGEKTSKNKFEKLPILFQDEQGILKEIFPPFSLARTALFHYLIH